MMQSTIVSFVNKICYFGECIPRWFDPIVCHKPFLRLPGEIPLMSNWCPTEVQIRSNWGPIEVPLRSHWGPIEVPMTAQRSQWGPTEVTMRSHRGSTRVPQRSQWGPTEVREQCLFVWVTVITLGSGAVCHSQPLNPALGGPNVRR